MDNVTTIQLRVRVKKLLENLKEKNNESFEEVIVRLIDERESRVRNSENLMAEGYKEMAEESLKITESFQAIENLDNWKW